VKATLQDTLEGIRAEYERVLQEIGDVDPYLSRTTIGIKEVLKAHFLLVEYFATIGEGLGGIGPKNINLLHSALFRQFAEFGGIPRWGERLQTCASLMYGLIQNHPFHDANKRTAFLSTLLHLQKIGRTPTISGEELEDFTVAVADHSLDKYPYYKRTSGAEDERDIATIAHFLKRSTREIDLRFKQITYNELNAIIAPHGLILDNALHNRIDVMRVRDDQGNPLPKPKRITRIGFHAWSREVSAKDIHILRAAANLNVADGYDSQTFFNGAESPLQLIRKYEQPLRRLAYR